MTLIVFFSSRISPFASTVIFCDKSPLATAVVTFAMLRTWAVRLPARPLTLSVKSFQVPETPFTSAWPPSLPSVTDFLRNACDFCGKRIELIDHRIDGGTDSKKLAAHGAAFDLEDHLLAQVATGDGGDDARDLVRRRHEVGDELVDRRHAARPRALGRADGRSFVHLALLADDLADAEQLAGHVLVHADDVV